MSCGYQGDYGRGTQKGNVMTKKKKYEYTMRCGKCDRDMEVTISNWTQAQDTVWIHVESFLNCPCQGEGDK